MKTMLEAIRERKDGTGSYASNTQRAVVGDEDREFLLRLVDALQAERTASLHTADFYMRYKKVVEILETPDA